MKRKNAPRKKQKGAVVRRSRDYAGSKNGFNRSASFKTTSTYVGVITIPTVTTQFRIDVLPTLSIFPIS